MWPSMWVPLPRSWSIFWRDVWALFKGASKLVTARKGPEKQLFLNVVIGTIPIVIAGFLLKDEVSAYLRNVELIAWTTIGFGLLLWLADKLGMTAWRLEHITWRSSLAIGLAQISGFAARHQPIRDHHDRSPHAGRGTLRCGTLFHAAFHADHCGRRDPGGNRYL